MDELKRDLRDAVGGPHVSTARRDLAYYGTDLSQMEVAPADFVVQPATTGEVATVVRLANEHAAPIYPRGGGLSYTLGYTPTEQGGILLDTSRMNAVQEIDLDAMSITAQTGCTWKDLNTTLLERGLRMVFWGPLSGEGSTLGGCISNNVVWYGSAKFGTVGDTLLGLEVVTPTGEVIRTGSGAHLDGWNHFRYYGPDLTGMFVGDSGAFGIKTEASFELMEQPHGHESMSFDFPTVSALLAAMAAIARSRLASEVFYLSSKRLDGLIKAGYGFLAGATEVLHASTEGPSAEVISANAGAIRSIVGDHGGRELAGELAGKWRDEPFMGFVGGITASLVTVNGEVWAPVHGIVPFAAAEELMEKVDKLAEGYADAFEREHVYSYHLMCAVKGQMLLETNIVWPDELDPLRRAYVLDPRNVKMLGKVPTRMAVKALVKGVTRRRGRFDEARRVAAEFRSEVADLYQDHGCVSFQIGRYYDFAGHVSETYSGYVRTLKRQLDPNGIMNPGVLGT
ncbi:MAG: FAD-binding oxidoreductase [bacterium]|nr:FAD-binding oxidoreductase [bacterium]MDE0289175.1 FAD-binding oxidoreductase [bacterium]MDE0377216.1 FAD-binding oxidoreductase [bacterium]